MQKELLPDFLHLFHNFGPHNAQLLCLLEYFHGNPESIRRSSRKELRDIGLKQNAITRINAICEQRVERDLAWAEADDNHLICFDDIAYPPLLRQINDYPAMLYARGRHLGPVRR